MVQPCPTLCLHQLRQRIRRVNHEEGPVIDEWLHYFPITMAVGIHSGGSMLMWKHAQKLKLLAWTSPKLGNNLGAILEIGNQGDANFWQNIKKKYPEGFDMFLDDGSHVPEHQFTTFVHMWSAIRPGGVLMIEDVHGVNAEVDPGRIQSVTRVL
mmetsp:Transcript_61693/g.135153  ORF Transcript_61693/g.135153 Transcript_61693/m.135153 type:complete len:154 (-) Transcript_61693:4-465(-)